MMTEMSYTAPPGLNWDGTLMAPSTSCVCGSRHRTGDIVDGSLQHWTVPNAGFQDIFADLFSEAFDILCMRQRKYGPGNISGQGLYGVVTRIADDKAQRIKRALNGSITNGAVEVDHR